MVADGTVVPFTYMVRLALVPLIKARWVSSTSLRPRGLTGFIHVILVHSLAGTPERTLHFSLHARYQHKEPAGRTGKLHV